MIEYLLLLFITVTMILLAMANLFKPMQNFLQNFMGTYVACLLTSGELPAIRVENTMKDTEAKCSFSMTGGNAAAGAGGPGSNGGTGNSNNSGSNANGANGNGSTSGNTGANGSGSGDGSSVSGAGGNSYAGSRSRRGGFGKSAFLRRSSDGGSGAGDDGSGGTRYVNNLDKNKGDRFFRARQKTTQISNRNGRGLYMTGMTEAEEKKAERKIQSAPRSVPKSSEEFSVPGRKSIVKPPPETKKKIIVEEEASFTLGNFFKYAMIAIVLLLILIIGGGQAFEMSKTMD